MGHVPIASLGLLVAVSLVPLLYLVALARYRQLEGAASRAAYRLSRLRTHGPEPEGPPLELLAVKLRRLRAQLADHATGLSMPKQRGTLAAYDAALVATAHALAVPTCLDELPVSGFDREVERLRLEEALSRAGMLWDLH